MRESNINSSYRPYNGLEQYRQTLLGIDLHYGAGFWEISSEALFTKWNVPQYANGGFLTSGLSNILVEQSLTNLGTNIDIKFEPPRLTGSFFALRFDHLNFIDESPLDSTKDWDKDVSRISASIGYKLDRNVEAMLSFSEQSPFDQSLYTFRAIISAFF